jgi:hypothetical protein
MCYPIYSNSHILVDCMGDWLGLTRAKRGFCYVFHSSPLLARNLDTVDQQRCSSLCHTRWLAHVLVSRARPTLTFINSLSKITINNGPTRRSFFLDEREVPLFTVRHEHIQQAIEDSNNTALLRLSRRCLSAMLRRCSSRSAR